MKLRPSKRDPRYRLVGLLRPGENGVEVEAEIPCFDPGVYFVTYPVARSFLVRGHGVGYGRRNKLTRYEFAEGKVAFVLPRNIEDTVTLADLCTVRDWCFDNGAAMGSVQGTAMSLLRATLDAPMTTAPGGPDLQRIAGGRVHSGKHSVVPAVDVWDINAAFASTLARFRPCGVWWPGRRLRDSGDQFVTCRIRVPETAQWGPLPIVPARRAQSHNPIVFRVKYPQDKTLTGTWTGDEVRSAVSFGAVIERTFATYRLRAEDRQPFAGWWEVVSRGRDLPRDAGRFVKAVSQALWGIFATSAGGAYKEWWIDRRRYREPLPDNRGMLAHRDLALADTLSARVRAKVYNEFIVPNAPHVLAVLTDGGMMLPGEPPAGSDWRLKDRGARCHFIDASAYRYVSTLTGEVVCHAGSSNIERNLERMALLERECFGNTDLNPVLTPLAKLRMTFPVSVVSTEKDGWVDGKMGVGPPRSSAAARPSPAPPP